MDARWFVLCMAMTLAGCAVIHEAGREYVYAVMGKTPPKDARGSPGAHR